MNIQKDAGKLRLYILGILADDETAEIDQQIISDETLAADLSLSETELIEDYLDGALTEQESELFRLNFLVSPRRREEIRDITLLRNYVGQNAPQKKRDITPDTFLMRTAVSLRAYFRPIAIGAAALVVGLLIFMVWPVMTEKSSSLLETEYASLNKGDLTDVKKIEALSTLNLASGTFRNGNATTKQNAASLTEQVFFRLSLPAGTPAVGKYRARLLQSGSVVSNLAEARSYQNPSGSEIRIILPKSLLSPGQYEFRIESEASEAVGNFVFTIE